MYTGRNRRPKRYLEGVTDNMVLTVLLLFLAQQVDASPRPLNVKTFEDIEIGMPETSVIGSLMRAGYTVVMPKPTGGAGPGRVVELGGKHIGVFWVDDDGRVRAAEERIYSNAKGHEPIDLAEVLYWLIHDEGRAIDTKDKDFNSTVTKAELTADDFVSRVPGTSVKRVSVETGSGNIYF